MNDTDKFE
ncbi:dynein light chain, putative, partial [Plasmodium reichenowi]